jgi:hypothetical protein
MKSGPGTAERIPDKIALSKEWKLWIDDNIQLDSETDVYRIKHRIETICRYRAKMERSEQKLG